MIGLIGTFCLMLSSSKSVAKLKTTPQSVKQTPAPLYRDPIFDGAADPVLVWNPFVKAWWMLYTQRRAKVEEQGVAWCHGTEVGVAESKDGGVTWVYKGTLPLSHPDKGYSFWAPDIIRDNQGLYHMFVSYVPGEADTHKDWGGHRYIFHYSSKDLSAWKFERRIPLESDYCIDPSLVQLCLIVRRFLTTSIKPIKAKSR